MKRSTQIILLIMLLASVFAAVFLGVKKINDNKLISEFENNKLNDNLFASEKEPLNGEDSGSESKQQTEPKEDEEENDREKESSDITDLESQIRVIALNLDSCKKEFVDALSTVQYPYMAVTDLNRNGRLELVITDCQGSGAFSYTTFYEVNENYDGLRRIYGDKGAAIDTFGDFYVNQLDCYKKDDTYYYVVGDYYSEGFSFKSQDFYSYSFDDKINRSMVAGYQMSPASDIDSKNVYFSLYDSSRFQISNDEEYFNRIEDYWKDYEKQPVCNLLWVPLPEENYKEALTKSFEGFATNSGEENVTDYDYKNLFDFYGEETIYTSWPINEETALYQDFLQNRTKLHITDKNNLGRYFNPYLLENHDLTLDELSNNLALTNEDMPSDWVSLKKIEYSYIDCGKDGIPELALKISIGNDGEEWDVFFIIKNNNGQLETVYSDNAWSRRNISLNNYGYIATDGSGGAFTHGYGKEYVDASGEWHYLYENVTEYRTPNEELASMGLKEDEYYAYFEFYFDAPSDGTNDTRNHFDSYAFVDDGMLPEDEIYNVFCYNKLKYDDSIYENDYPLKMYYENPVNKIYTVSEIEEMIAEKEKEAKVTDEIKSGALVKWYKIF